MFKSLLPLLERFLTPRKKTPTLEEFGALEKQLKQEQPKPRKSFEEALKKKLHQRYAELQEAREGKTVENFQPFGAWMRRWTLIPAVFALLIVVLGTGIYVTTPENSGGFNFTFPSPTAFQPPFGPLDASVQPALAPVMIAFDMPMLKSSVEEAFQITPAIEGRFIWNEQGTTLYFLPKMAFSKDVTYQLTLTEQAKNRYFKPLTTRYNRTFTTEWLAFTESGTRSLIAYDESPPLDSDTTTTIQSSPVVFSPSAESAGAEISFSDNAPIPPKDKNNEEEALTGDESIHAGSEIHLTPQDPFVIFRTGAGPLTEQELIQFETALASMKTAIEKQR